MPRFIIDYFELPTSDMDKSRRFLATAFGWGNKDYGPGYSEILEAGVLGGLNAAPEGRADGTVIGIRTDDIAAAQAAVEQAGGVLTSGPSDYPGGRRFLFREPGGAEWLVYCPSE